MGVIYGLHGPDNEIRYVGMTTRTLNDRLRSHKDSARKMLFTPLYEWMREIGVANIEGVVLETVTDDPLVLNEREQYWIDKFGGIGGGKLFNALYGRNHTEASKEAMSESKKLLTPEQREEIREAFDSIGYGEKAAYRKLTEHFMEKFGVSPGPIFRARDGGRKREWGFCYRGHSLTEPGSYWLNSDGGRTCKECRRLDGKGWNEADPRHKLTMEKAREIFLSDKTLSEVAREYGVGEPMVRRIWRKLNWKQATVDLPDRVGVEIKSRKKRNGEGGFG
jgi:hypothetical protein